MNQPQSSNPRPFRVPRYVKRFKHKGIYFHELKEVKVFMDMIAELNGYKNWIEMIRSQAWQQVEEHLKKFDGTPFHIRTYDAHLAIKLSTDYLINKNSDPK